MTRADLFKNIRSGVREYHRVRPAWHRDSVSTWLLKLMQANTQALLEGNWDHTALERYFYKMLSIATLCMDANGTVRVGIGPPLERVVLPEDTAIDVVLFEIDRGCAKYAGNSATDLTVMINYHLNRAVVTQPVQFIDASTLEEIRDIASLATLGLETKPNGDYDAKAN